MIYFSQPRDTSKNGGFTMIEVLTVIVIAGLLSAIALPSFLNQSDKAKMTEAKSTVGAVNRAQQAYRLESPVFASSLEELEIGLQSATENYTYMIDSTAGESATIVSESNELPLKNFSGGVFVVTQELTSAATCQTKQIGQSAIAPILDGDTAICTGDMESMQ